MPHPEQARLIEKHLDELYPPGTLKHFGDSADRSITKRHVRCVLQAFAAGLEGLWAVGGKLEAGDGGPGDTGASPAGVRPDDVHGSGELADGRID